MVAPLILAQELSFTYPNSKAAALYIKDWHINAGQNVFIQGKSGTGKSTLLNLIAGVHQVQSGKLTVLGQDLTTMSSAQLDRFRADNIGIIFQQLNLVPYLTVADNIKLASVFSSNAAAINSDSIVELLQRLQLAPELAQVKAGELSVGQQQRVAIARALINKPKLIIADEPTSALDFEARDAFIALIKSMAEESDCSVLFVSHDLSLASHFATQVSLQNLNLALQQE